MHKIEPRTIDHRNTFGVQYKFFGNDRTDYKRVFGGFLVSYIDVSAEREPRIVSIEQQNSVRSRHETTHPVLAFEQKALKRRNTSALSKKNIDPIDVLLRGTGDRVQIDLACAVLGLASLVESTPDLNEQPEIALGFVLEAIVLEAIDKAETNRS